MPISGLSRPPVVLFELMVELVDDSPPIEQGCLLPHIKLGIKHTATDDD